MADRKAELERKKAKLEAIRNDRKRKEEERRKREEDASKLAAAEIAEKKPIETRLTEADQLLKDLGIDEKPKQTQLAPAPPEAYPETPPQPPQPTTTAVPKRDVVLTMSKVTQTCVPSREVVLYEKETQTNTELSDKEGFAGTAADNISFGSPRFGSSRGGSPFSFGSPKFFHTHLEWEDEFRMSALTYGMNRAGEDDADSLEVTMDSALSHISGHKMPHVEMVKASHTDEDDKTEAPPIPEMSEEEKQHVMMQDDFKKFLDRTTRVMERALTQDVDIFVDYTGEQGEGEGEHAFGEKLKQSRVFFDEHWSKHRHVTCLDWSKQHPELLMASYNRNLELPHDPDGVCMIWNSMFKKDSPEYIFHCQSAVTSCSFAAFHPNLYIGGTYSGQVVLWDNRSSKRMPVQRTPLSASAHTHPIYCVAVVGTENAHNLITISTDGKACSWSLDMLSQPQDSMNLIATNKNKLPVAALCMSFLSGDVNNFVIGGEDGAVSVACRHGSKAGVLSSHDGHKGPVTGIDTHRVQGAVDFSHLYLTSSFDWTVKLWSTRDDHSLYTFKDSTSYVTDVAWSPIHPALYANVDGNGKLSLWNLNNETEVPTASTVSDYGVALSRCNWHPSGNSIAVGADNGKIHLYDVGEKLATPKMDEWSKFAHTLLEMKAETADAEMTLNSPQR